MNSNHHPTSTDKEFEKKAPSFKLLYHS